MRLFLNNKRAFRSTMNRLEKEALPMMYAMYLNMLV